MSITRIARSDSAPGRWLCNIVSCCAFSATIGSRGLSTTVSGPGGVNITSTGAADVLFRGYALPPM